MKTFTKVWIFIGFFLVSIVLGYAICNTIHDVNHLEQATPEVHNIKCQFNTKDEVPVSFDCSYFATLNDNPYKDKELCIKVISSEVIHEIFYDLCLVDCLQKRDEILHDIRQNLTTKVTQRFPDIEFQVIDIAMVFNI